MLFIRGAAFFLIVSGFCLFEACAEVRGDHYGNGQIDAQVGSTSYSNSDGAKSILNQLGEGTHVFKAVNGSYPKDVAELFKAEIPFVASEMYVEICGTEFEGYFFSCTNSEDGFEYRAEPVDKSLNSTVFFVKTSDDEGMPKVWEEDLISGEISTPRDRDVQPTQYESPAMPSKNSVYKSSRMSNEEAVKALLNKFVAASNAYEAIYGYYPESITDLSESDPTYLGADLVAMCETELEEGYYLSCSNSRDDFEYRAEGISPESKVFFIKPNMREVAAE